MGGEVSARSVGEKPAGPEVQVDSFGNLLLNPVVWGFVQHVVGECGSEWAAGPMVALLFDEATRTAAIRPLSQKESLLMPAAQLWTPAQARSREWPRQIRAREFCEHYRIGADVYPAQLVQEVPQVVSFAVGRARLLPTSLPGSRFAAGGVIE